MTLLPCARTVVAEMSKGKSQVSLAWWIVTMQLPAPSSLLVTPRWPRFSRGLIRSQNVVLVKLSVDLKAQQMGSWMPAFSRLTSVLWTTRPTLRRTKKTKSSAACSNMFLNKWSNWINTLEAKSIFKSLFFKQTEPTAQQLSMQFLWLYECWNRDEGFPSRNDGWVAAERCSCRSCLSRGEEAKLWVCGGVAAEGLKIGVR